MDEDIVINNNPGSSNPKGKRKLTGSNNDKKGRQKLAFSDRPLLEQKTMPYSIVEDMMHMKSNISFAQLANIPKYKNELKKALTPRRARKPKVPKEEVKVQSASYSNTPMTCKGQVGGWTIDIILDSGSSTSIMSKKFMEHIKKQPTRNSDRMITGIHGNKKSSLGIIDNIAVHIEDVVVSTDMEVIDTQSYTMVLGTDWLRKANAVIDYKNSQVVISDGNRKAHVSCRTSTEPIQQIQIIEEEEEESEEESDEEEDYEEDETYETGNTNLVLMAEEDESPDRHFYKFSPWGIQIDHETFTWQEYDYYDRQFNPWLTNQKYRHQFKHWYEGPDKNCWCQKQLKEKDDKCEDCYEDYSRWETIQVIPTQEVKNAKSIASLIAMGGAEALRQNQNKILIKNIMEKYPEAIAKDLTQLGRTNIVTHHIDTGNAREIKQHYYRMSPRHENFIKEEIQRLKQQGLIVPSHSPWTSPALVVGKANGQLRLVIDYRQLNKVTKPDAYPLPKIADMLDALAHSQYFSTLDLTSGFWQVAMNAIDQEKTAFSTKFGTYEFTVMPFGLMNAPATFQRLMDNVFYDITWKFALVYMDDIIIYSKTLEDHCEHLEQVLQLLIKAGLKLNPDKCDFFRKQILFLGHMVSEKEIKPNPMLVEKIQKCPPPQTKRKVRSFLGLASYYRRFIKDFSQIAKPLYDLTKQNVTFCWTENCEKAYEHLRTCLTTNPIVIYPDFTKPFILHTDASDYAVGAVLAQIDEKKREHVIAYASRILSPAECHYTVTEKECLAIIWATKHFHYFLQGHPFSIVTDHEAIPWLKKHKQPKGRLARWIIHLSEYDPYTIIKRKGSDHTNADALSRLETSPVDSLLSFLF
jgi:hypothetical protein